jgi:hypothetical protein
MAALGICGTGAASLITGMIFMLPPEFGEVFRVVVVSNCITILQDDCCFKRTSSSGGLPIRTRSDDLFLLVSYARAAFCCVISKYSCC